MNSNSSNINLPNQNNDSNITNPNKQQQLPLKAYFLNKYEQLKNPNSTSSLLATSTGKNLIQVESSVLSALLGDSSAPSPISSTLALYQQQEQLQQQQQQQQLLSGNDLESKAKMSTSSSSLQASKRHFSGSNSSLQNSDDDDEYDESNSYLGGGGNGAGRSKEEKRRLSHTAAEQKRRNAIKRGYDELQSIVPSCDFMDPSSSQKVCKATVLKRSIDYIHELQTEKDKHDQELDSLKKEITALKIMRQNYEEMLQYHRNQPKNNSSEINDDAKFELFVKFSDNLFQSFQSMINPSSFGDLSGSLFNWLEQMCSANNLKNIVYLSLIQAAQQVLN